MSIIELGALGEFLGSIGVIATLIYLAIQIRQNTHSLDEGRRLAMSEMHQHRADSSADFLLPIASSEELFKLWNGAFVDGIESLTPEQQARQRLIQRPWKSRLENLVYQYRQGYLYQDDYETTVVPTIRAFLPQWEALDLMRNTPTLFRDEVERILAESEENEQ